MTPHYNQQEHQNETKKGAINETKVTNEMGRYRDQPLASVNEFSVNHIYKRANPCTDDRNGRQMIVCMSRN